MLGRRIFRGVRNFDVNVTVRDGRSEDVSQLDDGTTEPGGRVRELRERLWREHLGTAFQSAGGRPAEGWLPQWRSVAQRNVAALNGADGGSSRRSPGYPGAATVLDGSFVLPYSNRSTPRAQLADVGVVLAPDAIELCFEPSWLEVHFSPNWVRNMFA
jgi:hypothetical protein